ncbi:MAG: cytochrome c maturation protein CcmE [Firmicutes bacterium]|nr:cytochrome c maturation protein CcmE [Bacillota bacterium]
MNKRTRLFIGVGVILAAIAFLMFSAFSGTTMYYYKVDEILAKGGGVTGKPLRVQGAIVPESVSFDIQVPLLKFNLRGESGGTIPVEYKGVKPDNMAQATSAIVEGRIDSKGVLVASKLLLQCPSKYESERKGS